MKMSFQIASIPLDTEPVLRIGILWRKERQMERRWGRQVPVLEIWCPNAGDVGGWCVGYDLLHILFALGSLWLTSFYRIVQSNLQHPSNSDIDTVASVPHASGPLCLPSYPLICLPRQTLHPPPYLPPPSDAPSAIAPPRAFGSASHAVGACAAQIQHMNRFGGGALHMALSLAVLGPGLERAIGVLNVDVLRSA